MRFKDIQVGMEVYDRWYPSNFTVIFKNKTSVYLYGWRTISIYEQEHDKIFRYGDECQFLEEVI